MYAENLAKMSFPAVFDSLFFVASFGYLERKEAIRRSTWTRKKNTQKTTTLLWLHTLEELASPLGTPQSCWHQSAPRHWRWEKVGVFQVPDYVDLVVSWGAIPNNNRLDMNTQKLYRPNYTHFYDHIITFSDQQWWHWIPPLSAIRSWRVFGRRDSSQCSLHHCLPWVKQSIRTKIIIKEQQFY